MNGCKCAEKKQEKRKKKRKKNCREIEVHDRDNQGIWNYYYVINNNLTCLCTAKT